MEGVGPLLSPLPFCLSLAATTILIATLLSIPNRKQRSREWTSIERAVVNVWSTRPRMADESNFWDILLARVGVVGLFRFVWGVVYLVLLGLLMGWQMLWLGEECLARGWVGVVGRVGR